MRFGNNDDCLVLVGPQDENLQYFGKNQDFIISNEAVSYKGQVVVDNQLLSGLSKVSDLSFGTYKTNSGEILPVIHVPNYEAFDRIRHSSAVKDSQYNYNHINWVEALKYRFQDHFDSEGNLINNIQIGSLTITPELIGLGNPAGRNDIWETLNRSESYIKRDTLEKRAKRMYRDFMKQLNYIQTRIPAQAMQSTMNIEVVDFADTDTNYIWVPKMLMLLQGSDLDIDKAYCMGYDVDSSGEIIALSDLIKSDKYDADYVLTLNSPTGGFMRLNSASDEFININAEDVLLNSTDYLQSLINLFKSNPGQTINLIYDNTKPGMVQFQDIIKQLVRDVNTHEQSYRSNAEKEAALRNQVLASARKIMANPASQLNAYTPIAMNEPRAAAKLNTALGSKEKEMTLDNPVSIFMMQRQNGSGKEVIAMTATGIKSYFIITTYFNSVVSELEKDLNKYVTTPTNELAEKIVNALHEITFDGKLGKDKEIRTIANLNLYWIKKLIKTHPQLSTIVFNGVIDNIKGNTSFNNYIVGNRLMLEELIEDLDRNVNGNTWVLNANGNYNYFVINAPDSLSALLSAATDSIF